MTSHRQRCLLRAHRRTGQEQRSHIVVVHPYFSFPVFSREQWTCSAMAPRSRFLGSLTFLQDTPAWNLQSCLMRWSSPLDSRLLLWALFTLQGCHLELSRYDTSLSSHQGWGWAEKNRRPSAPPCGKLKHHISLPISEQFTDIWIFLFTWRHQNWMEKVQELPALAHTTDHHSCRVKSHVF